MNRQQPNYHQRLSLGIRSRRAAPWEEGLTSGRARKTGTGRAIERGFLLLARLNLHPHLSKRHDHFAVQVGAVDLTAVEEG